MMPVVIGVSRLNSNNLNGVVSQIKGLVEHMRFVHVLEQLAVVSIGMVLYDAGIPLPVERDDIGLYVGIDNSIEDIKDEYFNNILSEGFLGASPQVFQFTTPNALTAQATIAFDIRGESVTLPIKYSLRDVIEYATDCIIGQHTKMAITGGITRGQSPNSHSQPPVYRAEFFLLEDGKNAMKRGTKVYHDMLG
ncbi:MAG: beta-ketoacyl synthase N-terminal-like domain-containing protein [Candidatus Brocadiales bacterium]